jgi:hypothetical protein
VRTLGASEMLELLRRSGFSVTETLVQKGMVPRMFTVASKP